jgi:signal transduction histidine kinase
MSQHDNVLYKHFADREWLKMVLFSLLAFCILAVSLTFFTLSIGKPHMGVILSTTTQGWTVATVDPNGLAGQAGIKVGEQVVEIDGQPAETFLKKYKKTGTVFGQMIKELTVINDRRQLKKVILADGSPSMESMIEQVAWLIISLIFWVTGLYTFFKRPRNAAALLLFLCGLAVGLALSANMAGERAIPVAIPLAIITTVIGPWLLLHFFLVLPEERTWIRNNPLVYLIYLPAAITLILFPLIGYADGQPLLGFRTFRLFEYGAGFLAVVGIVIFNFFKTTSVKTRQQMKIVLISCLAALIPLLILNILPQAIWRQPAVPPGFSILFIAFIPIGMGYAVVTQKLMDIDVVIRRSVIYGLVTIIMAAILTTAIFFVMAYHKSFQIPQQILFALASAAIAAILFGPIKKYIEILVDKFIYKDWYDYRQIIQSLSTALKLQNDSTSISRLIVGTIVNTLNLAGGCMFVKTQSGSFEAKASQGTFANRHKQRQLLILITQPSYRIEFPTSASSIDPELAFIIPLIAAEKEVGIMCLSPKASNQNFSSSDLYLLQGLVSVAAIALHSAILTRDVSIRDTFVSIASHELRTPMSSIMGYTELLLRRDPPKATRKQWLNNIIESGQFISNMVDDLLNVTRIQAGKVSMKLERVNISDVFKDRLAIIRESTNKHEFVVNVEADLPVAFVDHEKFGQVIGNLLDNAVKYSPGGGRITISANADVKRQHIVVSVADEGIGIDPADRDILFTTFHRVRRPETQGIRGSGLGLYIVKEWIEAMGGKIWLESELNKGSTFFLAIPMQASNTTT